MILPEETLSASTKAVNFISINMVGGGRYGSTQATMLSLQFLIEYFQEHGGKVSQGEIELASDGVVLQSVPLADHKGYTIDYSEGAQHLFDMKYSSIAGKTVDLSLQIVDLPTNPNQYQIGASYSAKYWDRDPPSMTSD
jgi:hypothetical protein